MTTQIQNPRQRSERRAGARSRVAAILRQIEVPAVDNVDALFSAAEELAAKIPINRLAADYLFGKSRWANRSREEWDKEIRMACAILHIFRQSRQTLRWEQVVNERAMEDAVARLKSHPNASRGTLFVTFHSGVAPLVQELFRNRGRLIMGGPDNGAALFAALDVLRDGGFVLIAPDGWQGQQSAQFNVLGATAQGGGGAAFLAYATRCNIAWYFFVRDGKRFDPAIELGPAPLNGETFPAFAERFTRFYERKLADVFSGDPRNIAVLERWAGAFARAARPKPEPRS